MLNNLKIFAANNLLGSPESLGIPKNEVSNSNIDNILNLVFMIGGMVAVIMVIVAGIYYSLSLGDPAKTAKAKNVIIYAVVGLVIMTLAVSITKFILGRI